MQPFRQTVRCSTCQSLLLVVAEWGDVGSSAMVKCPGCDTEFRMTLDGSIAPDTLQVVSYQRPKRD